MSLWCSAFYLKCVMESGCVAPADVGLVVAPGHVYDNAICSFHDVLSHHTLYRPRALEYT